MAVIALLLGVAQDGGVPQAGCDCPTCRRAWEDPRWRHPVVCLGLVDEEEGFYLIDATPDFPEQLRTLSASLPGGRLSGILLTHAHVGHYTGLIHLGKEVQDVRGVPLYVSQRMARFLQENAPWSGLVRRGNVELRVIEPETPFHLSPRLSVTPIPVPHRDEYSDTLAFLVRGATKALFYCPDIDSWDRWDRDLRGFLAGVNIALLDGTFFSADELGRGVEEVPHPPVYETAKELAGTRCDVRFIHLNHTNPLWQPGPERSWLYRQGFQVGRVGDRWRLG